MAKNLTPKFEIGQSVKPIDGIDADKGEVLGYSFDGSSFTYKISSTEIDIPNKAIVAGIKTCKEEELEAVLPTTDKNTDETESN